MKADFNSYFSNLYGSRWEGLSKHLNSPEKQICFSPFSHKSNMALDGAFEGLLSPGNHVYSNPEQSQSRSSAGHLQNYIMDPASLAPVLALQVHPEDQVLDLCAAPGGKSLGLLSQLGEQGHLLSNDSSPARVTRLRKVLEQYSPQEIHQRFSLRNKDGTKFGFFHPKEFSKILVDAPCSGERHQIHSGKTSEWSLKRSKSLAMKQYTLLCAALLCAQTEARIVYSTCSINPVENDEVVRRFLKKKKDFVKAASDVFSESTKNALEKSVGLEQTELGWIILPDTQGYGPIYFSAIQKTS